jgi:hypothetical protein
VASIGLGGFIVLELGFFSQVNIYYGVKLLLPIALRIFLMVKVLSLLATSAW